MLFKEIIGQKKIAEKLRNGVLNHRIPHAQLFLGGEGSGNLALALAYAQYLCCTNRQNDDSCNQCSSCHKFLSYTHPDLHFSFPFPSNKGTVASELYTDWRKAILSNPYMNYELWMESIGSENKQGNIPTKECHAILRSLSLKPFESEFKILLMWLPEFLGTEGNVLLKQLEEPSANTIFLLVAHNPEKILTTILSRVQMVRIPPILPEDVARHIEDNYDKLPAEAARISLMAAGDYLKAIELATNTENQYLDPFRQWMLLCYQKNMAGAAKWVDDYAANGREQLKGFFLYSLEILRAAAVEPFVPGQSGLGDQEQEFVGKFSKIVNNNAKAELIYTWLNEAAYEIERNGNPKFILTDISFKLARILNPV